VVNIDENTRETYLALRSRVPNVIVTHPNAPEDNIGLYRLLGGIFAREREAHALVESYTAADARLTAVASALVPRRVLYLIWRRPWMTVGRDTYISAMLRRVRWHTVPVVTTSRYPEIDERALGELGAEIYLLSSEPYAFRARHVDELRALVGPDAPIRLVDGEMLSWYGSRAIHGLDYLGRIAQARLEPAA
jgi:ABC-type Fe3+-hydroxamate transport system substrate-binding protein